MSKMVTYKKAVFVDRDGVIIEHVHHLSRIKDIKLIQQAPAAIKLLNTAGYLVIIITNQSVIGRGIISLSELEQIHSHIEVLFNKEKAFFDAIYFCPHFPDKLQAKQINKYTTACLCRKPKTQLLEVASIDFNIDLQKSYFIGDSTTDILAAKQRGIFSFLVSTGLGGKEKLVPDIQPDVRVENIFDAVQYIIN